MKETDEGSRFCGPGVLTSSPASATFSLGTRSKSMPQVHRTWATRLWIKFLTVAPARRRIATVKGV